MENPEKTTHTTGEPRARVLIMDDDVLVRDVALAALTEFGYEARAAEEGHAAVALYRDALAAGTPFDVVVVDLTVPTGLGGVATLHALRALDPAAKVIVASGNGSDPLLAHYADHGFSGSLAKPYRLAELNSVLERLTRA